MRGSTTSLKGNIVNNASLVFNQNFDGASAANISGAGNLIKSGSGAGTLGSAAYTGSTTVNGGVLWLTSPLLATSGFVLDGGMLGAPDSEIQTLKPITIGTAPGTGLTGNITALGVVSGGKLVIAGADSRVGLFGNNTFAGLELRGGTVVFFEDANLGKAGEAVTVDNGGLVVGGGAADD